MQNCKQLLLLLLACCCGRWSAAQKKVLDHTVYDSWQSLGERFISNNGQFVVYSVNVQEGDNLLVIQQADGTPLVQIPRGYNAAITEDSRYVICKIKPLFKDTRDARIKKKKPDDMPKDSLALYNLYSHTLVKTARVKSYRLPEENSQWLAYLMEKPLPETAKAPDSAARVKQLAHLADSLTHMADSLRRQLALIQEKGMKALPGKKETKGKTADEPVEEGTVLVLKNLATGEEKQYPLVSDYVFDKNGTALAYRVTRKNADTTSLSRIYWLQLATGKTDTVMTALNDAHSLVFDEAGKQLAFTAERDSSSKAVLKFYKLWYYKPGMDSAQLLADRYTKGVPSNWGISENATLHFSKSGARLFLGTAPVLPAKDTTLPEFERSSVDVWNYKDESLQTVQLYNLNRDLKRSYTALYDWQNKQVLQLANEQFRNVELTKEGDGDVFYTSTDTGRRVAAQWQGYTFSDVYAVDATTGKRTLVEAQFKGNIFPSYTGKYLLLYHDRKRSYTVYNAATHGSYAVGAGIKESLFDVENDVPDDPNPYGIAGWTNDDATVLVYGKNSIYSVDPANGNKTTGFLGSRGNNPLRYRYITVDEKEKFIDTTKMLYFSVYDDISKRTALTGYYPGPRAYTNVMPVAADSTLTCSDLDKAKDANVFLYVKQSFSESPNLYVTVSKATSDVTAPLAYVQLSHTNPQQAGYNWGKASLYKWKAYTGRLTEGVLYKPENFDPQKKYPMIVYFYERNNNTLYSYQAPAPTPSRLNIPFFVSRGYVVFVPDIWYTTGHPGKSAYDYIVSGTRALIKEGFIDSTKLGLQGQSWGGYQTAYLITQTNLYAAAWAGAPVVNMFSAYGGIRWESGLNRQFQYEKTQSRIGATIWDKPQLYVENSPLFHLPKVKTPLVIMSNDADGAVPWYQGIEFFTAMRRLNKPVWLLDYNGEAHNLVERRNRKDIQVREQQFFDWLLQGAQPPKWITDGVPAVMKGRTWGL